LDLELLCRRVDPDGGGLLGWLWGLVDEAVWIVAVDGAFEKRLEESGALGVGDAPAHDPTAEDIDERREALVQRAKLSHTSIPVLLSNRSTCLIACLVTRQLACASRAIG